MKSVSLKKHRINIVELVRATHYLCNCKQGAVAAPVGSSTGDSCQHLLTFFITIREAKKAIEDHLVSKQGKCIIGKGIVINSSLWDNGTRALEQRHPNDQCQTYSTLGWFCV